MTRSRDTEWKIRATALLVHAPAAVGDAAVAALERLAGTARWTVRTAADRDGLTDALAAPVDLVAVWEGAGEPGVAEVLELVAGDPVPAAVVAVLPPARLADGPGLVEAGAADYLSAECPQRLGVVGRRVVERGRLGELPDLVRSACHELNNLLAPIPLATGLLRGALPPDDRVTLDDVESAAARATRAVDALYRVALGDPGPGLLDLRGLLDIAARRLRDARPGRVVETDHPEILEGAVASPRELLQVLACLAKAVLRRCTGEGIGLAAEAVEGEVRIDVTLLETAPGPQEEPVPVPPVLREAVAAAGWRLEPVAGEGGGSPRRRGLRLVLPQGGRVTPPGRA